MAKEANKPAAWKPAMGTQKYMTTAIARIVSSKSNLNHPSARLRKQKNRMRTTAVPPSTSRTSALERRVAKQKQAKTITPYTSAARGISHRIVPLSFSGGDG